MTVASGREFLSIPGPTNIPDAVLGRHARPAIDIYAGDMLGCHQPPRGPAPDLPDDGPHLHLRRQRPGGWEAALSNVLSRGETVLVLESGLFARRAGATWPG